ncbi:MAG: lipopolysaccharide heptosyltransferase I [Betaproteobacteria bacterium HGW-Betaproteobacteria-11]|nr:MAG: lipopolysaccharide heptosyltransferase I [Betaproteobacteria bacterium HGW-Betaproteobacteria-11]
MRILLVKTSSLGDVVHNLPVASDLAAAFPEAEIDWVVEENYAAIVRLHPRIRQVLPVALRRWRKTLTRAVTWRELGEFRRRLRATEYDLVIDTQGLLKSALIAAQARGLRCGYAAASAREPLAAHFYQHRFEMPRNLHAVTRNRQLVALAAGYSLPAALDYGLTIPDTARAPQKLGVGDTAILLTNTSRADKRWPAEHWLAVGRHLSTRGIACLLPAGNAAEGAAAQALAATIPHARVLEDTPLEALAREITHARLVIGVDTGLVHLAAALGRPTLALFAASDPELTGVLAGSLAINLGRREAPPTVAEVLDRAEPWLDEKESPA